MELTPEVIAARDRQAREWCANPHAFFKAFSRTARRFQHMNQSPRYRVMTLVGEAGDFLPLRPLRLQVLGRAMRVSSWEQVFSCIVGEVAAAFPQLMQALDRDGRLQWIARSDASADIQQALDDGSATMQFATLDEAFCAVQWLLSMAEVKLNEVIVQVDPYASDREWLVRQAEIRAKREEEKRVLREIDDARRRYAEEHPEVAAQNGREQQRKDDLSWEI